MGLRIGITLILEGGQSLFGNGIVQNIILLRELLEKCSNVEECLLVNVGNTPNETFAESVWGRAVKKLVSRTEALGRCDLLILCHGYLSPSEVQIFRRQGGRVIKHELGASQSFFTERILFESRPAGVFHRMQLDAVWMSPHFYGRDRFFAECLHDCPVHVANYIWDPRFIEAAAKQSGQFDYRPSGRSAKRLVVAEPNFNMVKTCVVPITIAELWERGGGDNLERLVVLCGDAVKQKRDMVDFVSEMNIHRKKKIYFGSRIPITEALKSFADIIICHQDCCELSYLYLDAAWLGYPVLHNSPLMSDLGWYYHENDVSMAIRHLDYLSKYFDENEYPQLRYQERSRELASRYMIDRNVARYEELLGQLI